MHTGYLTVFLSGRKVTRRIFYSRRQRRELMDHFIRLYGLGSRVGGHFELSEKFIPGLTPVETVEPPSKYF